MVIPPPHDLNAPIVDSPQRPTSVAEVIEAFNLDSSVAPAVLAELESKSEAERAARREKGRTNIVFFARYYFASMFEDATPAFHWHLTDAAKLVINPEETGSNELVIAAPRGHAKSTWLSFVLPIWCIVYKVKRFIVIISETDGMAAQFVNDIKIHLESNERLRDDFGDLCGDTVPGRPLKWTQKDFIAAHRDEYGMITHKTKVLARGTGGQIRGLKIDGKRPDLVIGDDLENDEFVNTPEQRNKIWNWFMKAVQPGLDPKRGTLIIAGTVLHFDSLLNRLLKLAKQKMKTAQAKAKPSKVIWRFYQAIDKVGRILWPERFNREFLDDKKLTMGGLLFNCEYLNLPIDEATRLYRPEWIRWYTRTELGFDAEKRQWSFRGMPMTIFIGIDPAISESDKADYFGVTVIGHVKEHNWIIFLYATGLRIDFPTQVQEIIRMEATWPVRFIGIEKNGYQRVLPQQVIKESTSLKIKQLDNGSHTRKYTRILAASIPFENGQCFFPEALPDEAGIPDQTGERRVHHLVADLYEQMMQYPASAHDDILDSMENAFQLIRKSGRLKRVA